MRSRSSQSITFCKPGSCSGRSEHHGLPNEIRQKETTEATRGNDQIRNGSHVIETSPLRISFATLIKG